MADGHYLTPEQYDLFMRMGQWFKSRIGDPVAEYRPNIQHVRITGAAVCTPYHSGSCGSAGGGVYYPGQVVAWDAIAETWREAGVCWVRDANETQLVEWFVWKAKQSGNFTIDGQDQPTRPVFVTDAANVGDDDANKAPITSVNIDTAPTLIRTGCYAYLKYFRQQLVIYDNGTVELSTALPEVHYGGIVDLCACDCESPGTPPFAECAGCCTADFTGSIYMQPAHAEVVISGTTYVYDWGDGIGFADPFLSWMGDDGSGVMNLILEDDAGNFVAMTFVWWCDLETCSIKGRVCLATIPGLAFNCCFNLSSAQVHVDCTGFHPVQISGSGGFDFDVDGNYVPGGRKGNVSVSSDCGSAQVYLAGTELPGGV